MPVYRFYFLNELGQIRDFVADNFSDDDAAVRAGEALRHKHPWIEIWCGARKVHGWLPPPPQQAAPPDGA